MPGLDKTGPMGEGPRTGGGFGRCGGTNKARRSGIGPGPRTNQDNDSGTGRRAGVGGRRRRGGFRRRGRMQDVS